MRLITFLLLFLPCICPLDILMYVNIIGGSHLRFADSIISLLNKHGHNVDVILGMLSSSVKIKGDYGARKLISVHFPGGKSPWGAVAHVNSPFVDNSNPFHLGLTTFYETSDQLCDLLLESSEVAALLSSNKYDLALLTGYDFCPFAIAHHHNITNVVSYVPTPAAPYQNYYAGLPELPLYENIVLDTQHGDRSTFSTRLLMALRTIMYRRMHDRHIDSFNAKFRSKYGPTFPDVREIAMNTSIDFVHSHPVLEEPKPISFRMRYIGGIAQPASKPIEKELSDILDRAKKGNVIFSFGTQIEPEKISEELRNVFINTFKRFPDFNFIWKFDGTTEMNAPNVINMKWLPQTDLLHDSRVVAFISHMGLNSFTESSFAGVPIVAIPLFVDQLHNARRAVDLGTGVMVRKTEITVENLSRALEQVLLDERYLRRSQEIASIIAALPDTPQRVFLEGLELAAKFKNVPSHSPLAGVHHHYLVQNGWDVAAFLTLIIVLLSLSALKVTTFILNNLSLRASEKAKEE